MFQKYKLSQCAVDLVAFVFLMQLLELFVFDDKSVLKGESNVFAVVLFVYPAWLISFEN